MGHTAEVDDNKMLNAQKAAEFLGIDLHQLLKLNEEGAPYYKVSKQVFYNRDELVTWLESRKH